MQTVRPSAVLILGAILFAAPAGLSAQSARSEDRESQKRTEVTLLRVAPGESVEVRLDRRDYGAVATVGVVSLDGAAVPRSLEAGVVMDRTRVPVLRISARRDAAPGGPYGLEGQTRDRRRIGLPFRVQVVAAERATPSGSSRPQAAEAVVTRDGPERNPLQTLDVVQGATTTLRPDGDFGAFRVVRAACSIASTAGEPQVETTITAELASSHGVDRRTLEPTIGPSTLVIAASEAAEPGRYARLQGADAEGHWNLLPICIRVIEAPTEARRAGTTPRTRTPEPEPEPEPIAGGSCPEDYFTASEIAAAQPTRFRFPVPEPIPKLVPEPAVIHMDHEPGAGASKIDCVPYQQGHLCYDGHDGTDFSLSGHVVTMSGGVQVVAAADGVVRNLADGNPDLCTWVPPDEIKCLKPNDPWNFDETDPNYVELCHADGTRSSYYHLQKDSVQVEVGQSVACGELLGKVGSSGHSSGPHLHFAVSKREASGSWAWVDPYDPQDEASLWTHQYGGIVGSLPGPQCQ